MNKRILGTSDLSVPILTLGTMTWGQQNTETEAHEQLSYAVDERGLYFIDTAEIYPIPPDSSLQGLTETYIGNWIAKRGKRDDLVLASKVSLGNVITSRDTKADRYDAHNIRDAVEGTLRRLQTDYIDLCQIHWPERDTNYFGVRGYIHNPEEDATSIEETLTVLGELVNEGKIRHIGVSNETPWGVAEYLRIAREKSLPRIVSIQNQYSLTNRTFEIGLAEFAMREKVDLLAYSTINGGVLTGKYLNGARPEGARFTLTDRNFGRYNPERAQSAIKRYVQIARDNNLDPAQLALAFVASREFTGSVIIGATSVDQLKRDIDAADTVLSDAVLEQIEAVHEQYPDVTH